MVPQRHYAPEVHLEEDAGRQEQQAEKKDGQMPPRSTDNGGEVSRDDRQGKAAQQQRQQGLWIVNPLSLIGGKQTELLEEGIVTDPCYGPKDATDNRGEDLP